MWAAFLNGLAENQSVDNMVDALADRDEYLAIEIAVYWCSPPAGPGCDDDEFADRESDFAFEDVTKSVPASGGGDADGAQFFNGHKGYSRARKRR